MSWTEDQLDKLRAKVGEARRQGAWISAAEAGLISTLIATIRRLTMSKGWSGVPEGRLPTIGESKAQGISKFTVHCSTPQCWAARRFSFDDLGLTDDVVFVDIPKHRRFVCRKCGSRTVTIMADWPKALQGKPGESHNNQG